MSQKKILVADDEKPLAQVLVFKLQHEGFKASMVANGEEALEFLANEEVDLVLLDLMMPKLDGFGVLEAMQKKQNHTPVIVSSNLSQPEQTDRALALGACGYYVKSNTSLKQVIDQIKAKLL